MAESRIDGPGIGHNRYQPPSDEVVLAELAKVNDAWRLKEEAKKAYQGENARYRRTIKDARARGLNPDAILDAINSLDQDPADITQRISDRVRYSRLLGLPLGSQSEMFEAADVGAPSDLGREKVQGRKRTGPRVMEKANPYPKGSWQSREFERGWQEGAQGGARAP